MDAESGSESERESGLRPRESAVERRAHIGGERGDLRVARPQLLLEHAHVLHAVGRLLLRRLELRAHREQLALLSRELCRHVVELHVIHTTTSMFSSLNATLPIATCSHEFQLSSILPVSPYI